MVSPRPRPVRTTSPFFHQASMTPTNARHRSGGTVRGGITLIRARFLVEVPTDSWIAEISTTFPDATFRLLTGVPKGDRSIELGEVRAETPGTVTEAIRRHRDVSAYESLYEDSERAIAHYEATEQRLYEFLWESSLPPEFPVLIQNGEMEFDVTATREQFDAFGNTLDASGRHYELLSVVETGDEGSLLTERQRECLRVALRHGYFEVPRGCTLADVADTLGIDPSTASETIRRGTASVVGHHFVGTD